MDELEALRDRERVIDTVNSLFLAVDERDWDGMRGLLADRVVFDVTSLGSPAPRDMTAAEIIASWQEGLANIEAVHHQSGNFRVTVEGDQASCFCYGIAYHYRLVESRRNLRVFVGTYDYRLAREDARWRITHFKFNAKFVDGNLHLSKEAPL
jgi:hypothetical protein